MASIKRFLHAGWFSTVVGVAIATTPAHAQSIVRDNSLGSRVTVNGNTYTIDNGLESGGNLFHSLSEFGLLTNEIADFESNPGTLNIITRVTGGNSSTIDGILRAGDVNLFIINPNGLTFTANATLDIGRSFVGSTAGSLLFEDGSSFTTGSATAFSGTSSMPSVFEIPEGGAAPINVIDTGVNGFTDNGDDGLKVELANTLALIGGDITSEGGILQTPKGNLYLAALSGGESVSLSVEPSLGTITLETPNSNAISADADSVLSLENSILTANLDAGEEGLAGIINLRAGSLISLDNETQVQSLITGIGEPGLIRLTTGSNGTVSLDNDSVVFTTIERGGEFQGEVGIISVNTGFLAMDNGSQLLALVREARNGEPAGIGEPGNIFVSAEQGIELRGQGPSGLNTGISTALLGEGTGSTLLDDGGNLLTVLEDTSRIGELFGSVLLFTEGDILLDDGAFISTSTISNGNAGAVFIDANNVFIENGSSVASSAVEAASGSAGVIFLIAENDIVVKGNNSFISSVVGPGASTFLGVSGDQNGAVLLSARRVGALNGGVITVDNDSTGEAGALIIGADLTALNRESQISAAASGDANGGDIVIFGNSETNAFFTVLANQSNISTSTDSGVGGDIFINVSPEIIAAPSQDSNIITESPGLNVGASIDLASGNPFLRNITVTDDPNSPFSNDVSAASTTNADGTVNGGSLENSLLQNPLLLPTDLVDPSRLIAQGCAAGDLQAAQNIGDFTLTGRDGLSATPEEQISSSAPPSTLATLDNTADLAEAEAWVAAQREQTSNQTTMASNGNDTVEAQTWRYGSDGQVVLMAQADSVPSSSVFPGFSCNVF